MNLFSFFSKQTSAPMARERLQVLLAHAVSYTHLTLPTNREV